MRESAKTALQLPANQQLRTFSTKELVLPGVYKHVYETLYSMWCGPGLCYRLEFRRVVSESLDGSSELSEESRPIVAEVEDETNLVLADYLQRKRIEQSRLEYFQPEPILFAQLIRTQSTRSVRKIVNQSHWLSSSRTGGFLSQEPARFLGIKLSPRFPKSPQKQIDFLARSIAGMLVGYEPATAYRYLGSLIEWCQYCREKPALLYLQRGTLTETQEPRAGEVVVGDHTAEQCVDSTWPCPLHPPSSPDTAASRWCGDC